MSARWSLLWACVVAVSLTASPAWAKPKVRTYTVQPGDSIWSIAETFYGSGSKYQIIYKHNKFIGAPPYILKPGQVLTLPVGELTPEAQVEWLQRQVKAKPPRSLDWLTASREMNLWKLYKVSTGDESAVHIVFEDDSDLRLGDNALLVIYGGSKGKAQAQRREKTHVLLEEGTARGGLAALDAGGKKAEPMLVETPSGMVELASQMAQIQASAVASAVSVYQGEAKVKSQGAAVAVKSGFGTVVKKGKPPEKPRPLPAPPDWEISGGAAVAVVPAGGSASFEAAWKKVSGAHTYRVELAHDEAFKRVPVNVVVDATTTRFNLENVPVGRYFARISARDASGLEGRPSTALAVDVVGLRSSRRPARGPDGGWEVVGFSRLDLGDAAEGLEWALDDGDFAPGAEPARVQGAGEHRIRVRRQGESLETVFALRVLGVTATLELASTDPLPAGGEPRDITLTAVDERGEPAALPDVKLEVDPGEAVAFEPTSPGRWIAHLPAPAPPGPPRLALRASWPGGELASAALTVKQRFPDEPYRYSWRPGLGGLVWDRRGAPTGMPGVTPIDRMTLRTAVTSGTDGERVGLALGGELALLDGALGLDASWTLLNPSLSQDELATVELGDAELGARYLAYRGERALVAASLRARLPVARRDGRAWGLEPSALARYRAARDLWLDTRQGVLATLAGDGDEVAYIGDYAAIWRLSDLVRLTAQLDTALVLSGPAEGGVPSGLAGGLGAQLHLDRLRVGLTLGFGLGSGGQQRFGDVFGAITLDFGQGTPRRADL
ncbi:MAG: LysM peptidoglycan-binding domain-containing protein [Deltaproteobacteria bacterium]|nr:MAG: LysM peptidoglycan-binding domain-containing protein [Deltaproteobacteria bacterium]